MRLLRKSLLLWFLAAAVLFFVGSNIKGSDTSIEMACLTHQLNSGAPAADVLFIGSSQIGSAVDPVFIASKIHQITGYEPRVERLIDLGADAAKFQLDFMEYVNNRGHPKIVVINAPLRLERIPSGYDHGYIYPLKTIRMHKLSNLLEVQSDFLNTYNHSAFIRVLRQKWKSLVELAVSKVTQDIYLGMRYLPLTLQGKLECKNKGYNAKPGWFPYDELSDGADYKSLGTLKLMADKHLNSSARFKDRHIPIQARHPARFSEFEQLRQIALRALGNVDKLYVTTVPLHNITELDPELEEVFNERVPNAIYVDSNKMYDQNVTNTSPFEMHRNYSHLNYNGAHIFSVFWAQILAEHF